MKKRTCYPLLALALVLLPDIAAASPSGAEACAAQSPAAAEAIKRRVSVALYYELKLAIAGGSVYEWRANAPPRKVASDARHVAVSASHGHLIDGNNRVWRWSAGSVKTASVLENVAYVAAGDSGMLAIRCDGSLWRSKAGGRDWMRAADTAIHAWVGDSADYYIDEKWHLYVTGKAHRGQYGNGLLKESNSWVVVANDAVAVYSHTGHAVYLRRDGAVMGTGGNRNGPLGTHGYGDKAIRWGVIFEGASRLGTGSSHSMAVRRDGSLWGWGSRDGLQPKLLLADVIAATGGDSETLAMTGNETVWNWRVGSSPIKVDFLRNN